MRRLDVDTENINGTLWLRPRLPDLAGRPLSKPADTASSDNFRSDEHFGATCPKIDAEQTELGVCATILK